MLLPPKSCKHRRVPLQNISAHQSNTALSPRRRLSWAQSGGHSVIPKSVSPARIASNFEEIDLSPDDLRVVDGVGKEQRRFNIPYIASE
jgi:L-glyceraldehyde reductase